MPKLEPASGNGRVLIACKMIEDEVREALARHCPGMPVVWVEEGFHNWPDQLRAELQRQIDRAESLGYTEILMAFGLCGTGAAKLVAHTATLVIPRFDDCINFMLCCGQRCRRGYAEAGIMYITRGWARSEANHMEELRRSYELKYGEKRGKRLMKAMFGNYKGVSIIQTGCYDEEGVLPLAQSDARELDLPLRREPGSIELLEKLVSGKWDGDILLVPPGTMSRQSDFDWEPGQEAAPIVARSVSDDCEY